jgi:hypothetical protein
MSIYTIRKAGRSHLLKENGDAYVSADHFAKCLDARSESVLCASEWTLGALGGGGELSNGGRRRKPPHPNQVIDI